MATPKRRLNIELHLSLSATFLSLAALIVSVFQTKIARDQQQKSVLPYLQIRHQIADNGLEIILENKGVGPAFIDSITIQHGSQANQVYNDFVVGSLSKSIDRLNRLDKQVKETEIRRTIARDPELQTAFDWFEGSKKQDIIESGSALKEGDQAVIYAWQKKGLVSGPYLNYLDHLLTDSTYQIKIKYNDVYNNCWRLVHKLNRNTVAQLPDCGKVTR